MELSRIPQAKKCDRIKKSKGFFTFLASEKERQAPRAFVTQFYLLL